MTLPLLPGSEAWLRRYARQVVLAEVGERGQRRLGEAAVSLVGRGEALVACATYLASAGVGRLDLWDPEPLARGEAGRFPFPARALGMPRHAALAAFLAGRGTSAAVLAPATAAAPAGALVASSEGPPTWSEQFPAAGSGPVARAEGALAADAILRRLLGAVAPEGRAVALPDGTVRRGWA